MPSQTPQDRLIDCLITTHLNNSDPNKANPSQRGRALEEALRMVARGGYCTIPVTEAEYNSCKAQVQLPRDTCAMRSRDRNHLVR